MTLKQAATSLRDAKMAAEASDLRVKFEAQLWDVAKQLHEKKR